MPKRRIAVSAVVFNEAGEVLLVNQGDARRGWELPGGRVKKRESPTEALAREVREETGVEIEPVRLLGIFFIRKEGFYDLVFAARPLVGQPRACPPEIIAAAYHPPASLPEPIRPFTRQRILDAMGGVVHPLPIELEPEEWLG
jgi:ADP-ribose pyrophosphatase YjhB (NUDIX family)